MPARKTVEVESSLKEKYMRFLAKGGIDYKQHQYDGVKWCVNNETCVEPVYNVRGGFIADEMGLGKTIMMIGTMVANFVPKTLIVVPVMLMQQWWQEIYRTTGHRAMIYHGDAKKWITLEDIQACPIVITTYNTLSLEREKKNKKNVVDSRESSFAMKYGGRGLGGICLLHDVKWDRAVFDEGHHLRNKNNRYFGCTQLKTRIRWIISGTPIQNRVRDLYNLCNALGIPSSVYMDEDVRPILGKHFVLRRTKAQLGIALPALSMDSSSVEWSSQSEKRLAEHVHKTLHSSPLKIALMTQARKSCILPSMLKPGMNRMVTNHMMSRELFTEEALSGGGSKLNSVVQTILDRRNNGAGKLVFCHFREEIDVIAGRLKAGGMENVASFDGRDSKKIRGQKLANKYDALILQIQTGCEGLNLQKDYSEIYFVTPHWNPSVEDQAVARCHRIGQSKPVIVFRFEMSGFVDSNFVEERKSPITTSGVPVNNDNVEVDTLDRYITLVQQRKRDMVSSIALVSG